MTDEENVEFEDVKAIHASELALCCLIDGKTVWIPQSQIHDGSEVWKAGDQGTLVLTRWIAAKKGLV